jgi:hypothetical protein
VGPAIPLVWLRLLADRDVHIGTLEDPSCGGFVPTA